MDRAEHLRWLEVEGARLGEAARAAGAGVPVPTCPGWSVADLLVHAAGRAPLERFGDASAVTRLRSVTAAVTV